MSDVDWAAVTPRLLWLLVAAVLLRFGRRTAIAAQDGPVTAVVVVAFVGLAIVCLGLAAVDPAIEGVERALALLAILLATVAGLWIAATRTGPITDALAFGHYGADLLLAGENPYATSMRPALDAYPREPLAPTNTTDGGLITQYSYPAGSVLAFVPGAQLASWGVVGGVAMVGVIGVGVAAGIGAWAAPARLAPVVVLGTLLQRNLYVASAGGVIDGLWLAPVAAAIVAWDRGRWRWAGLALGVAVAVKQQPWIVALGLTIVVARTQDRGTLRRFLAPLVAVPAVVSLPFLLWGPLAYLRGVFVALTPLSAPMVQQGIGLVHLSTGTAWHVPHAVFHALLVGAIVASLGAIWRWPRRAVPLVWGLPAVWLFWSYRSLANYVMFPAAVLAVAVVLGGSR